MYLRQVLLTAFISIARNFFNRAARHPHKSIRWLNLNLFSELECPRLKQLYDRSEDRAMFVIESFN